MSDLRLNALRRKLETTEDPDRVAALEQRIADLEATQPEREETAPGEAPDEGLAGLSKADLLDLAEEAGVEGRSSMTKAELIEALGGG